jgi:hypothetical protein
MDSQMMSRIGAAWGHGHGLKTDLLRRDADIAVRTVRPRQKGIVGKTGRRTTGLARFAAVGGV